MHGSRDRVGGDPTPPPPSICKIKFLSISIIVHVLTKICLRTPPPPPANWNNSQTPPPPPRKISWIHVWTLFSDCSIALLQVWQSLFTVNRQLRHIIYLKDVNLLWKRAVWQLPGRSLCNHLKLPFNFAQKNNKSNISSVFY